MKNEKDNYDDLFNLNVSDFTSQNNVVSSTPSIYSINCIKNNLNGVAEYKALLRFVKNPRGNVNIVKTLSYYIKFDDMPVLAFQFHCPTEDGKYNIMRKIFNKVYNDVGLREKFKSTTYYYSIVKIVKDFNLPHNDDALIVFRYGETIYKMLQDTMVVCPNFGNYTTSAFNVTAPELMIHQHKGSRSFPEYTKTKFTSNNYDFPIKGNIRTKDTNLIDKYLQDAPILENYIPKISKEHLQSLVNILEQKCNHINGIQGIINDINKGIN